MDAKVQFKAPVSQWEDELHMLESIVEDPGVTRETRAWCIHELAKLVTKMQRLLVEVKDPGTIH